MACGVKINVYQYIIFVHNVFMINDLNKIFVCLFQENTKKMSFWNVLEVVTRRNWLRC